MYDAKYGRLTKSNVRKKWPNEEVDFTPWLAENLNQLSSVLGLSLEFPETEKKAGRYKADILARDSCEGGRVVVENQLAPADLQHLGQLVTYVGELKADYGVWIATRFNGTIRRTLRSLNRHWPDSMGFFAVQLGLLSGAESFYVPTFNIVEYPTGWGDPVAKKFWDFYSSQLQGAQAPSFDDRSTMRRRRIPVKEANLRVTQYFKSTAVRVYVTGNQKEPDAEVFARIKPYRKTLFDEVEKSEFLAGDNPRCTTEYKVLSHNSRNWGSMVGWLDSQCKRYISLLSEGNDTSL